MLENFTFIEIWIYAPITGGIFPCERIFLSCFPPRWYVPLYIVFDITTDEDTYPVQEEFIYIGNWISALICHFSLRVERDIYHGEIYIQLLEHFVNSSWYWTPRTHMSFLPQNKRDSLRVGNLNPAKRILQSIRFKYIHIYYFNFGRKKKFMSIFSVKN